MNRMFVFVLVLVSLSFGCNQSAAQEASVASVTAPVAAPEPVAAPAPDAGAPKAVEKPPPFSEDRCERIVMPFRKCGWRCSDMGRGGSLNSCVRRCEPLLKTREQRLCVNSFGPMFN